MHLWNDYEGTTLAGQWTLGRLLRTEGRSALFATTRTDGRPAVLRLTEALNDQAVLQARYRAIQAAGDTYLVAVEGFGDAELDGAPLSYAVLEPTQESLAEIVAQRRLDAEEVHEVAKSVAGGLLALHAQGLVHGLVEPESVLAATDRIKLRSDCARPAAAPEDADLEGAVTERSDALGLAGVIYQALTQGRLHDASDALALPEPFAAIVRNTARGAWGVPEIAAELARHGRAQAAVPPASPAASAAGMAAAVPGEPHYDSAASIESAAAVGRPLSSRAAVPVGDADVSTAPLDEDAPHAWRQPNRVARTRQRGIAIAVAAVVVLALVFLLLHRSSPAPATSAATVASPAVAPVPEAQPVATPADTPKAAAPAAAKAAATSGSVPTMVQGPAPRTAQLAPGQKLWRVVAYTYNRRAAADQKAASLNQRFPGFSAGTWTRTGQRPFLVTLGGELSEQQAFALRARARKAGVARDVYAQNYSH